MNLIPINIPKNMRGKIKTVRHDRLFVSTGQTNSNPEREVSVMYHPKGMKTRKYWEKFYCGIESVKEVVLTKEQANILLLGKGYLKQYFAK